MKIIKAFIPFLLFVPLFGINDNQVRKVNATEGVIPEGRYFIVNDVLTYGMTRGNIITGATSKKEYDLLDTPYYFEMNENGDYKISVNINSKTYYVDNTQGQNICLSSSDVNLYWTITNVSGTKYHLEAKTGRKYFIYHEYNGTEGFITDNYKTGSSSLDHYYLDINLIGVETSCVDFVTAIDDIDCSGYVKGNKPSIDEWNAAKDQYDLLPQPVKNYLKTAVGNKNASSDTIEYALAKYDYIAGKYEGEYTDYMLRDPDYPTEVFTVIKKNNQTSSLVIIVSVVSLISVGGFLLIKHKRID